MWWIALAFAGKDLVWEWEDTSVRYVLDWKVQSPYVLTLLAEKNKSVRVSYMSLSAVVDCHVFQEIPNGRGWDIECDVEDASVSAQPLAGDEGRAPAALASYTQVLKQSKIRFRMLWDGRIRSTHLTEPDHRTASITYIHQRLERLVDLGLSPLNAPLPMRNARLNTMWVHKDYRAHQLPIEPTVAGNLESWTGWVETYKNGVRLEGNTKGSMQVGRDSWSLMGTSNLVFRGGSVVEATVSVGPNKMPVGLRLPYRMAASARRLSGKEMPKLAPPREF